MIGPNNFAQTGAPSTSRRATCRRFATPATVTRVYEEALAGRGFGIEESRPAVELSYRIRQTAAVACGSPSHPFLTKR